MPEIARHEHLFVVRMRREPGADVSPGQWRGSVEHVASHQRLYFTVLGDLTDFIALHLQAIDGASAEKEMPAPNDVDAGC
jgi:hypothetical protein